MSSRRLHWMEMSDYIRAPFLWTPVSVG